MTYKIFDGINSFVELSDNDAEFLFSKMNDPIDPRVSGCIDCRSCVVATDPFQRLIEELKIDFSVETEWISLVSDFLDESNSVHLYIWEDNECLHRLWRDPLAVEWSSVTGEKRLR